MITGPEVEMEEVFNRTTRPNTPIDPISASTSCAYPDIERIYRDLRKGFADNNTPLLT
jgi:hypothetical protein